jgi:hypothetical protein
MHDGHIDDRDAYLSSFIVVRPELIPPPDPATTGRICDVICIALVHGEVR